MTLPAVGHFINFHWLDSNQIWYAASLYHFLRLFLEKASRSLFKKPSAVKARPKPKKLLMFCLQWDEIKRVAPFWFLIHIILIWKGGGRMAKNSNHLFEVNWNLTFKMLIYGITCNLIMLACNITIKMYKLHKLK